MKKIFISFLILCVLFSGTTSAQTPSLTPTAKPTDETTTQKLSNQINNLKEKIASRVAQLNLVEKRGIIGTVKEVDGTKIVVTDLNDKTRNIDVDEITKFSSSSAKATFGISDIKPGTKLSILGLYNKDSERILARFITVISTPLTITGAVSKIDDDEFTITVSTENGQNYIVDVENITRTLEYIDNEVVKSGFSKIETGERVMVVGYTQSGQSSRLVGTRILLFPELLRNPKIILKTDTDEIVPSSGSGKVITPIR